MKPTKQEFQSSRYLAIQIKQFLFLGFLVVFGLIGLSPFRPFYSEVEKRDLKKLPTLSLKGLWYGDFFSNDYDTGSSEESENEKSEDKKSEKEETSISAWYSDTYPLRELLISMNAKTQSLYGFRGEQMLNEGKADEIPEGTVDLEALAAQAGKTTTEPAAPPASSKPAQPAETNNGGTPVNTEPSVPATTEYDGHGAADVDQDLVQAGSIYIANGAGYGVYYFSEANSAKYCLLVNKLAENLKGKAQLYSMLCPISAGVMLSERVQESIGCSDEAKAADWFYRNMDPSVKTVAMVNALRAHNDEYIFFRTDHHWTALGAYYAYREWCKVKGVTPHELSYFEDTYTFEGFLGTFYSNSDQNPSLAANPDTVIAYVPKGTNTMTMYSDYNSDVYNEYTWRIIYDVSNYPDGGLYGTFAGGDQPYNYAHNEEITDGSSVLVVKDSYANAFIPFLIDHYEYVYWIDFRNYKKWCRQEGYDCGISSLVERKGIQDVILCQNISIVSSSSALEVMEDIFR
jgi:hypothetical protein